SSLRASRAAAAVRRHALRTDDLCRGPARADRGVSRRLPAAGVCPGSAGSRHHAAGLSGISGDYTFTPVSIYHGVMALNLKNAEVERLAAEVARLTGESKTEAIRRALEERRQRLKGPPTARRRTPAPACLPPHVW